MRRLILLFITILCFGCTANYHLKINDDLTVEETITGMQENSYYNSYYNSSKKLVVDNAIVLHKEYLDENNYTFDYKKENSSYGAVASLKYNSIDDYYKRSKVYEQYFENMNIKKDKNIVTINLDNKKNPNGTGVDGRYTVDDGNVLIELPFKVLKHNADKVNKNVYTWNINSFKGKKIYIKFDTSKKAGFNYNIILYLFIGFIILSISYIIYKFVKNKKQANNI